MVGLNRRYYETIIFAKKFIKSNKRILIKVSLPESFKNLILKTLNTTIITQKIHLKTLYIYLIFYIS